MNDEELSNSLILQDNMTLQEKCDLESDEAERRRDIARDATGRGYDRGKG